MTTGVTQPDRKNRNVALVGSRSIRSTMQKVEKNSSQPE